MSYSTKRLLVSSITAAIVCYLLFLAAGVTVETRRDLYERSVLATINAHLRPTDHEFLNKYGIYLATPTYERVRPTFTR